ncbi:MAG: ribosome biogenesis GTP-binding protein YihA/YsxC [Anaerotardibacter sp.]
MNYNQVRFVAAYGTSSQIPESKRPEISFVGRSNVGKSSLINRLFNRKKLAKVSSTPGKTSTVNFFTNDEVDFIDLPGYGYAKVAKSEKARWSEMIEGYYDQYRYYALVVSLIDIRHPATKLDEQMIEFLTACRLPFVVCLTKADKVSNNVANKQKAAIRKQLNLPKEIELIVCSSEKGTGFDQLKSVIEKAAAGEYLPDLREDD